MVQESCREVALLLDKKFLQCEGLLFHPMQNDYTTVLAPEHLTAFLEHAGANFAYVDLECKDKLELPSGGGAPKGSQQAPEAKQSSAKSSKGNAAGSKPKGAASLQG